tara:strand:+ start:1020 stop:1322 length:303 start_codon:yes stop_codon:yes gene_type:complete
MIFVEKGYDIPNAFRQYEDFFYDTFIDKITKERPEFNVKNVEIDYLDKGVKSWKQFSKALLNKFPHLEALKFEQNTTDELETVKSFFISTGLKYLHVKQP